VVNGCFLKHKTTSQLKYLCFASNYYHSISTESAVAWPSVCAIYVDFLVNSAHGSSPFVVHERDSFVCWLCSRYASGIKKSSILGLTIQEYYKLGQGRDSLVTKLGPDLSHMHCSVLRIKCQHGFFLAESSLQLTDQR
jgi:hypothetical protein